MLKEYHQKSYLFVMNSKTAMARAKRETLQPIREIYVNIFASFSETCEETCGENTYLHKLINVLVDLLENSGVF